MLSFCTAGTISGRDRVALRAATPPEQIPALDGIRGLAILLVVLHNATVTPLAPSSRWLHALPLLWNRGWIGVQLFFALSGFLITLGLLETRGTPGYFRNFYAKRALRILPLYYTVLLVLLVILPRVLTLPPPFSSEHQAPLWLFTANLAPTPYGFGHFWSLAVEEQFYLFWPLVVFKVPPPRLLKVCGWIAVAALVVRWVLAALGTDPQMLYVSTACRMDALSLGAAGACVLYMPELREGVRARLPLLAAAALLVFAVGMPLTHFYNTNKLAGETLGYTLLAISCAAFVLWAAMLDPRAPGSVGGLLAWSPLRSCGKYSYAMYVSITCCTSCSQSPGSSKGSAVSRRY